MNLCRRFSQAIVDSYNSKLTSNMPIVILAILVLGARAGPPGLSVGPSLNPQLDADLDDAWAPQSRMFDVLSFLKVAFTFDSGLNFDDLRVEPWIS